MWSFGRYIKDKSNKRKRSVNKIAYMFVPYVKQKDKSLAFQICILARKDNALVLLSKASYVRKIAVEYVFLCELIKHISSLEWKRKD